MQGAGSVSEPGAAVSAAGYPGDRWYPITVPATVLAGLVQNNLYPDLYYSNRLQTLDATPFAQHWWYRTEFMVPADYAGKSIWLHFDGINYRADVWLNGQKIAGADQVVGTFRQFELDITQAVRTDGPNALALEITPPSFATKISP